MSVSRETQLDMFIQLLGRWGHALNLTSLGDRDAAGLRSHVEDSLTLLPFMPPAATRFIDIGSGQGFPAIPLAIMSGLTVDLVEADRRKAAFLTTVLAQIGLPGQVYAARVETTPVPPALCVTARAVAPLPRLLAMVRPLLAPGGLALLLKGPKASDEITEASRSFQFVADIVPTRSPRSNLVRVSGLR